jgi:hypothetical protein
MKRGAQWVVLAFVVVAAVCVSLPRRARAVGGWYWSRWAAKRIVQDSGGARLATHGRALSLVERFSSLIDSDNDGDAGPGDLVLASGQIVDATSARVGAWDATFAYTGQTSTMVQLTLRFPRRGSITIAGEPVTDGSPFHDHQDLPYASAPIVGVIGRPPYKKEAAAFTMDPSGNLAVMLAP